MSGLPNFPEEMTSVIHTKYQYRGKSHNLRSNVVRILRFLIQLDIQIYLYPKICNQICSDPDTESHGQLFSICHSKKTSATSSGAHELAHLLKGFVDTHPLAAKSINFLRI